MSHVKWPENANVGSLAMHLHFKELVNIWNYHAKLSDHMSEAAIDETGEFYGRTVIEFHDGRDLADFLDMFELKPFEIAALHEETYSWVQLHNAFDRNASDAFFNVLDAQRIELMSVNEEWCNGPRTLNEALTHSAQIFHRLKRSHEAITFARTELGRSLNGQA